MTTMTTNELTGYVLTTPLTLRGIEYAAPLTELVPETPAVFATAAEAIAWDVQRFGVQRHNVLRAGDPQIRTTASVTAQLIAHSPTMYGPGCFDDLSVYV